MRVEINDPCGTPASTGAAMILPPRHDSDHNTSSLLRHSVFIIISSCERGTITS